MSVEYAVDTAELEDVITRMTAFYEHCQQEMEAADAQIARVRGEAWTSEDAQAYEDRHRDWAKQMADMAKVLGELKAWVARAKGHYEHGMAANKSMFPG